MVLLGLCVPGPRGRHELPLISTGELEATAPPPEPVGGSGNSLTGVFVTVTDNDGGSCGGI